MDLSLGKIKIGSDSYFSEYFLETGSLSLGKSAENQKNVSIAIECPGLDVQQPHQILQLNEPLPLQIDFVGRQTFARQTLPVQLVPDSGLPMDFGLNVGFAQCFVGSLETLAGEEWVVL